MRADHDLGRYHHEQARSNSCVAACITIARLRTGEIGPQGAAAHELTLCGRLGLGKGGILIDAAAFELDERTITADPDNISNLLSIRANLASGRWWHIVILFVGEMAKHHRDLGLTESSRHGRLPALGIPHAVMLVGVGPGELVYLDPWFPAALQPQRISDEHFLRAWTGMYIPVALP